MFRRMKNEEAEQKRRLRGSILSLLNMAVAAEVNTSDPYEIPGRTISTIIQSNATTGSSDGQEIRGAVRYLEEKQYVRATWQGGDFVSIRMLPSGVDLVESGVDTDPGVLLHSR